MGLSVPHAWRSCAASAPGPAQLTIFRRSEHAWRNCAASAPYSLNLDALDLVERDVQPFANAQTPSENMFESFLAPTLEHI